MCSAAAGGRLAPARRRGVASAVVGRVPTASATARLLAARLLSRLAAPLLAPGWLASGWLASCRTT